MAFNFLDERFVFFGVAALMGQFNSRAVLAIKPTPAFFMKSLRLSNTSLGVRSEGAMSFLGFIMVARLDLTRLAYLAGNRRQNKSLVSFMISFSKAVSWVLFAISLAFSINSAAFAVLPLANSTLANT